MLWMCWEGHIGPKRRLPPSLIHSNSFISGSSCHGPSSKNRLALC